MELTFGEVKHFTRFGDILLDCCHFSGDWASFSPNLMISHPFYSTFWWKKQPKIQTIFDKSGCNICAFTPFHNVLLPLPLPLVNVGRGLAISTNRTKGTQHWPGKWGKGEVLQPFCQRLCRKRIGHFAAKMQKKNWHTTHVVLMANVGVAWPTHSHRREEKEVKTVSP